MMLRRKQFDRKKFIDRESEQKLFEDLLTLNDTARILAIRDDSGMGKSHLLELFRHRCWVSQPRTPVSLVDLKQLPDQSPMMFVKAVVDDLAALGVAFPNFNAYESARVSADFNFIRASIYLQGASFRDARDVRIAEVMTNVERVETIHVAAGRAELTAEQREKAEVVCVRSFLDDVCAHCAEQPVVLLIDSFERCGERLFAWLHDHFLDRYFFDQAQRPAKLLLVMAGQKLPDFESSWGPDDCAATVQSVLALHRWTRTHVEQCFNVHDFKYEERDIDTFHRLVERGLSTLEVIRTLESLLRSSQKGAT